MSSLVYWFIWTIIAWFLVVFPYDLLTGWVTKPHLFAMMKTPGEFVYAVLPVICKAQTFSEGKIFLDSQYLCHPSCICYIQNLSIITLGTLCRFFPGLWIFSSFHSRIVWTWINVWLPPQPFNTSLTASRVPCYYYSILGPLHSIFPVNTAVFLCCGETGLAPGLTCEWKPENNVWPGSSMWLLVRGMKPPVLATETTSQNPLGLCWQESLFNTCSQFYPLLFSNKGRGAIHRSCSSSSGIHLWKELFLEIV